MHDRIKALKKENNELRKNIAHLEQNEEDIIASENAKREAEEEAHKTKSQEYKDEIARTKVELDKLMSTKLIIWDSTKRISLCMVFQTWATLFDTNL